MLRAILVVGLLFAAQPAWAEIAGRVVRLQGSAQATGSGAAAHALAADSTVDIGDTVTTGPEARLQLRMIDGTAVTLGERAELVIDDFVFTPQRSNGLLRASAGAFRVVTGGIGGLPDKPLRVVTPVAAIGIRGTDFWGGILGGDFNILLLGGAITVRNAAGQVDIDLAGSGTTIAPEAAPQPPVQWSAQRRAEAIETIGFTE